MSETYWNEDKQSGVIEITQEDYEAALARGLTPDETMRPGRYRFERGGFLKRHGLTPKDIEAATVLIEIKLPLDREVFNYFKQRAAETGAESYQAYINEALRRVMESERKANVLAPLKQELLADQQFIGAVAAAIAARTQTQQQEAA
jgi:uncharacterized protein (DUF4415 family)